jgi:predicted small metal-binding protein
VRYILIPKSCQAFAKFSPNPRLYYSGQSKYFTEADMAKIVACPCGETITGETDDELVRLVQEHGKEVHGQEVTREDALAMAQPAD